MPSKRTIKYWLKKYPEFRCDFEDAVAFRNQCMMDDCIDMADDAPEGANLTKLKMRIDARWKQLSGASLKVHPGAVQPSEQGKAQIVERDPLHGQLYEWELEYQRRRKARSKGSGQDK